MTNSYRIYRRLGHTAIGFILLGIELSNNVLRYEDGNRVSYDDMFTVAQTK